MAGWAAAGWGLWMGLVVRLIGTRADGGRSIDVLELSRPSDLGDIASLG